MLLSVRATESFGGSFVSNFKGSKTCVSLSNRPCQAWPTLVDTNSDEILFYPFNVSVNKCGGSCNLYLIHMLEDVSPIK